MDRKSHVVGLNRDGVRIPVRKAVMVEPTNGRRKEQSHVVDSVAIFEQNKGM